MKPTSSSSSSKARVLRRLAAASLKKMNPTEMPTREEPLRRTVLIRRTFEWVKQQQRQLDAQDVYDLPLDNVTSSNTYHDPVLTLPRYIEDDSTTTNTLLTPDAYDWSWLGDDRLLLTQIISNPPQQSQSSSSTMSSTSNSSSPSSIPANSTNTQQQQQDSLLSHTIPPPTNEQDDDLNAILLWNYRQTMKRPCPEEEEEEKEEKEEKELKQENTILNITTPSHSSNSSGNSTKRVKTTANEEPPAGPAPTSPVILSV